MKLPEYILCIIGFMILFILPFYLYNESNKRFLAVESEMCRSVNDYQWQRNRDLFFIYDELHKKYPDDKRIKALRHDAWRDMYYFHDLISLEWKNETCKAKRFYFENK